MEEMYAGAGFIRSDFSSHDQVPFTSAFDHQIPIFESPEQINNFSTTSSSAVSDAASVQINNNSVGSKDDNINITNAIRAKIASHPLYPKLLQAYIDCQKV